MTSQNAASDGPLIQPDFAPVPQASLGPARNEHGYYVGRVERNLFWVTDGTYQSAFLATRDGVVLFDAPPTIGHNLRRAVDEITEAEGVTNKVTHLVYSHHHADHAGAATLFGEDVIRIGHVDTRRLLLRDADPTRPAPQVTFEDRHTLEVGGERVELEWHGPNHSPDNIFIHFPDHDALMSIDIVNAGWVPVYNLNLSEDVPGYLGAGEHIESYAWKHLISGHLGRLATRDDLTLHRRYLDDIVESSRAALASVDPTPHFGKYGENVWAGVRGYQNEVTERAAAPVIAKYTGVLAAADVTEFTTSTTFMIVQSLRLDQGVGSRIHP
jgi:glyoxylase-like metal-dependent hydrolase (beta-lactamase superfamily II)